MTFREIMTKTLSELLGDYRDRFDPADIVEQIRKMRGGTDKQLDVEIPDAEAEQLIDSFRKEFPGILNYLIQNKLLTPKS